MHSTEKTLLEQKIIETLRTCFDPEIPVNIYDLGLIYGVDINDDGKVGVQMTLTAPSCPVAGSLPEEVERKIRTVEGVSDVSVELVWTPSWDPSKMSDEAKLSLGMM